MLRLLVVVLLVANAAYFAWAQGYLQSQGLAPQGESEPQRLEQQLQPQGLRILSPSESRAKVAAAAPEPPACLQTGVLDEALLPKLRTAATEALPQGSWWLENAVVPARWIVYMGQYPDNEVLEKKKAELRTRRVSFQALNNPALQPGLSLGSYPTQEQADQALADLGTRGIRTARVLQERPAVTGQRMRLPAVDEALRGRLHGLKPVLGPLEACT